MAGHYKPGLLFFLKDISTILSNIHSPEDVKKLSNTQLSQLSKEIRKKILEVVGKNGGHLASNLGVVELTIALHRVFNSPQDAIIWDVSHQSYTHKLLTGRYDKFDSIRQKGGISGFTRITESKHDYFDSGHASTSISSALGLLTGWELTGRHDKVVAVIGDGALTGGLAFEALFNAGQINKNLIVILNDNQMSISENTGSLSSYLSRLTMTSHYQRVRRIIDSVINKIPFLNKHLENFVFRFKRGLKGLFFSNNLFVDLGFEYVGPLNGHNIEELVSVLNKVKKLSRPVVVHVVTKKGKGYSPAENDPASFHGVGPFSLTDGKMEKFDSVSYTEVFSNHLVEQGKKNENIVAITAAMSKGTGLSKFQYHFPERFFDVGIAEEHAVTFAGGLAAGGEIPIVAIYSTFLQRSIDQIIHDIALQNRHVIFCIDRAGAVPGDGETHQGIFDISLLRPIPGLCMLSPATAEDMKACFDWALKKNSPVSIRYPKASCTSDISPFSSPVEEGKGVLVKADDYSSSMAVKIEETCNNSEKKVLIVCTGGMYGKCLNAGRALLMKSIRADIYSLRFIKPFNTEYFSSLSEKYDAVIFVEDGVKIGGVSEYISNFSKVAFEILAFPDSFMANGSRDQILEMAGLSSDAIVEKAEYLLFGTKKL